MDSDSRATELMSLALSSGQTPEDICHDCPELTEKVRQKLAEYRRVEGQIQAWFPSPSRRSECGDLGVAAPPRDSSLTPEIPGYEIDSILGRGGMGVVYRAKHLRLNRWVAIKILSGGVQAETDKLERFLREAEAVACLQHSNIVQVYDIGEFNGQSYFTMELMEGGSLAHKLSGTPQQAKYAAELVATLAGAVHAAHEHGIIHRDLKPSNILFTADGKPKISDFGLARRGATDASDLTLAGTPIGTPSYMSPCQAQGLISAMGPATDVYSLGAILYEMVTGRPPFRGESPADTERQVINDPPVHPSRLNPRVPRDLETICLKCLEKVPKSRYASALALAEDLRRFERHEPIKARPVGPVELAVRWLRRKPALAGALALGSVLALALFVTVLWWHGQQTALRASAVTWAQADLSEADHRREIGDLSTAAALLERAKDRLGGYVSPELRTAISRAALNLELAQRLESIRLHRVPLLGRVPDTDTADQDYNAAFLAAGLLVGVDDQASAAARIKEFGMTQTVVAALEDWAVATRDETRRTWCLGVAGIVDKSSTKVYERLRDPRVWADRAALTDVLGSVPLEEVPLPLIVAATERLQDLGGGADAVRFLKLVDRQHPSDFGVHIRLAFALVHQGNWFEAAGHYRAALALRPRGDVCDSLGSVMKAAGQFDEAFLCFERAVGLDPAYAPAYLNLGVAYKRKGEADRAMGYLRRAVELDPDFVQAHIILASALQDRGDHAGAVEHYEAAVRLDPTFPEPHYNLGLLYAGQGRESDAIAQYDEAIRLLRKAVESMPEDVNSRTSLGKALQAQGKHPDEVLHHLREGVRLRPDGAIQHAALGQALLAQGKLSDAEVSLRRALELLPESDSHRTEVELGLTKCLEGLAAEKAGKPPGG
ncbi:MAG: tetratricopeptide repeat protein [Phycisphaerales bacterium]|nr:tetratricopeptide repeat protein [Phycisphaerales bacterium]